MSERVPVKQAAKELGIAEYAVREYMRRGILDIGFVVEPVKGKRVRQYPIFRKKLDKVLGKDVN